MASLYHFGPDAVANLTETQLSMYMENSGAIRLLRDMPQLAANFAQLDKEARQKLIDEAETPPDPNSLDSRAWKVFIRNYQTAREEAAEVETITPLSSLSPEAAEGIVQWWSPGGGLYDLPEGPMIWREHLMPIYRALTARAAQMTP
ncbi:hypothetical protein Q0M94_28240 (plasmid) [Deinococcus radiomollis]|uniref:hypothetical protein n=1 Tax=Deinococcus radiomollis TaxID=468916 RepID=UPI003891FF69